MNRKTKKALKIISNAIYYSLIISAIMVIFFWLLCLIFGFPNFVFLNNFE